jgi:hypothetical protein
MKAHVFGVTADGGLWHTVVAAQDHTIVHLQDYSDLDKDATGGVPWTGTVVDAACAADDQGNLHVLVVADGKLWHTVRAENGQWTPVPTGGTAFGDVGAAAAGEDGKFSAVAAYTMRTDLHVLAATNNKKLWHTIRKPTGNAPIHEVRGGKWISPSGVHGRFEEEKQQGEAKGQQFRILDSVSSVK